MAVYVGRWDCTSCGYKGVLGPKTECTNCGADRPKNVKFYMADDSDIVQDPEVLKKARSGANWVCSYCTENNEASVTSCKSCGNNRNASEDKNLQVKEYDTRHVPRSGDNTKQQKEKTNQVVNKPRRKINKKAIFIAIAVVFLLVILLGKSNEVLVTVESFKWERTIEVQKRENVEEEAWQIPSGGKQISSFRAIHHYNSILDHYETRTRTQSRVVGTEEYVCGKKDMGNGYFEDKYCTRNITEKYQEEYEEPVYRKEPVYETKYRYSIYRWNPASPATSSGTNHNAEWADVNYVEADPDLRESKRYGVYTVFVRDEKNESHKHEIPERKWKAVKKGSKLKAKRGLLGDYRGLLDKESK